MFGQQPQAKDINIIIIINTEDEAGACLPNILTLSGSTQVATKLAHTQTDEAFSMILCHKFQFYDINTPFYDKLTLWEDVKLLLLVVLPFCLLYGYGVAIFLEHQHGKRILWVCAYLGQDMFIRCHKNATHFLAMPSATIVRLELGMLFFLQNLVVSDIFMACKIV